MKIRKWSKILDSLSNQRRRNCTLYTFANWLCRIKYFLLNFSKFLFSRFSFVILLWVASDEPQSYRKTSVWTSGYMFSPSDNFLNNFLCNMQFVNKYSSPTVMWIINLFSNFNSRNVSCSGSDSFVYQFLC